MDMPWWGWILMINGVIGVFLFEMAWLHTRRFRNPNLDLDEIYPAFRRLEARRWNKFKFYPGAVFLFVPRFILMVTFLMIGYGVMGLLMIGHNDPDKPIIGIRNKCLKFWYNFGIRCIGLFTFFFVTSFEHVSEAQVNHY